jgi:hypothetical protein
MKLLIYSPNLNSDRQVFCDVFTDISLELGLDVVLLVGLGGFENLEKWLNVYPYHKNPKVKIIDCYAHTNNERGLVPIEDLINIQRSERIDFTIFAEADYEIPQFISSLDGSRLKLIGKNIGVFAWTQAWWPRENAYTGEALKDHNLSLRPFLRDVKNFLSRNHEYFSNKKMHPRKFFPEYMVGKRILDIALVKDERVTERYGLPFVWLPDIYRSFRDIGENDFPLDGEQLLRYQEFTERNRGKDVLLYFGTSKDHRGYTKMLELSLMDEESVFVHCGLLNMELVSERKKAELIRNNLYSKRRIFETNHWVASPRIVEAFYNSIDKYVSTHALTGSSGTLLQAIELGKPILTGDKGLIGYRTSKYGLGEVYEHNNMNDLFDKWKKFKRVNNMAYSRNLNLFSEKFSRQALSSLFQEVILA